MVPGQAEERAGPDTHSHPPTPPFPSWILFDEKNFEGDQHILSEGEFPTLTAMGCLASTVLGSLRKVPLVSTLVQFQATPEAVCAAGGVLGTEPGHIAPPSRTPWSH